MRMESVSVGKVDRGAPISTSKWLPKWLRGGFSDNDVPPGEAMFAISSKSGCAVVYDLSAGPGEPGVSVGEASGVGALGFSAAHEAGHCATRVAESFGISSPLGSEARADLFALWAVMRETGVSKMKEASVALLSTRARYAGTPHAEQAKGLESALFAVFSADPSGSEGFVEFMSMAGVCDGRVCPRRGVALPSGRVGWFATEPPMASGEGKTSKVKK